MPVHLDQYKADDLIIYFDLANMVRIWRRRNVGTSFTNTFKSIRFIRRSPLTFALASSAVLGLSIAGAPSAQAFDAVSLVQRLHQAKALKPDAPVNLDTTDTNEVTLTTLRPPTSSDKDLKIDAVLAAKELMQADPKEILRVKVDFFK